MKLGLRLCAVMVALLLAAGCVDTPTGPSIDPRSAGPARIGAWMPGGGGKCDPWLSMDWCEGDSGGGTCLTSEPPGGWPENYVPLQTCGTGGDGGGGSGPAQPPPPPPPADTTCKTENPVLNDAGVQQGFKSMWQQSGVELPQDQRRESAAWIVRNTDGSHQLVPLSDMIREPCGVNGNWNAPPGAVGFVHTHPFASREVMVGCGPITRQLADGRHVPVLGKDGQMLYHRYSNRPSPRDRDLLQNVINHVRKQQGRAALEGYVIDNERITRYSGLNEMKDQPYNRCGY